MMKKILFFIAVMICSLNSLQAQHTAGISVGYGSGSMRPYPKVKDRELWGLYSATFSWRHYTKQKYVGCFGIDLEYLQQGFSYAPYSVINDFDDPKAQLYYYTRKINSVVVPIVWQPHMYFANNRLRVFAEAAFYTCYNFSSDYTNEVARETGEEIWQGEYNWKTARDNRFGFGLTGGAGFAYLHKRLEFQAKVRYYFGYGDIVRNMNKYSGNTIDGAENPFITTPLRSPLDNMMVSVGVNYRFSIDGFDEWKVKRMKREKTNDGFSFDGVSKDRQLMNNYR